MRLAARSESKAAEANSEAKSAGGKEWEANSEAKGAGGKEREAEFLFFYRCHTSLVSPQTRNLQMRAFVFGVAERALGFGETTFGVEFLLGDAGEGFLHQRLVGDFVLVQ